MKRRLLNLLTALSLLLCVVYTRVGAARPGIPVREWDGLVSRGVVRLSCLDYVWNGRSQVLLVHSGPCETGTWWRRIRQPPTDLLTGFWFRDTFWHQRGFAALSMGVPSVGPPGRISFLAFPVWLPAGLIAAYPVKRLIGRVLKARAPGLCPSCSYDLRATPGRCPECGNEAALAPQETVAPSLPAR